MILALFLAFAAGWLTAMAGCLWTISERKTSTTDAEPTSADTARTYPCPAVGNTASASTASAVHQAPQPAPRAAEAHRVVL